MSSNRDNDGGGINIASSLADGQRGDYNLRQDGSVINADGTIVDDGPDDTTGDAQHSIAELQRIQADTLTDDEFDESLQISGGGSIHNQGLQRIQGRAGIDQRNHEYQ